MPRFFVEKKNIFDDIIIVEADEARHISRALRLSVGDSLSLFDKAGYRYKGVIVRKTQRHIEVKVIKKTLPKKQGLSGIILCQAIAKGKKMDIIVQKSTELGVSEIITFYSARTIPQWDYDKAHQKVHHWKKIIIASMKQSGATHTPILRETVNFRELICRDYPDYLKLIFWEEETEQKLKNVLTDKTISKSIIFLVGPEGGFSTKEIEMARESGFQPVGLGDSILRTETVSLTILSILQYERGHFQ
jgi:16S rRNA (uracil1498-N3)-methyltransferase